HVARVCPGAALLADLFSVRVRHAPTRPLFPSTTLFRSTGVELRAGARGGDVEIAVVDRGMGIAPEDAARVFEPFFRAERSRSRRSEEHTSELQSLTNLVCRLLLQKKTHRTRRDARSIAA